jgi:Golgi nucleoside diphosphatase
MPRKSFRIPVLICLLILFFYLLKHQPQALKHFAQKTSPCSKPFQYAIVLDAGSTGSRIHIYKFSKCLATSLEDEVFKTTTPGLSSLSPSEAAHSLDILMNAALESVPPDLFYCTPLTLKATAGLRMLKDGQGLRILEKVEGRLREYPFPLVKDGVEIMAGEQEGMLHKDGLFLSLTDIDCCKAAVRPRLLKNIISEGGA